MSNFRPINRDTDFLLPPSVDEWLPERHLARFVVEVIDQLDLSAMVKSYRGSGSASYHPAMLLGLLIYGYATKVFSSRAIERATYDSVAFRYIAGNEHPDHDTIAAFRKRFLPQIEALFVEVLKLARAMGVLKLGTVALDGTKVHANASRHSALSYGHAKRLEKQLKREVRELLKVAEQADAADIPDGMSIPEELERREGGFRRLPKRSKRSRRGFSSASRPSTTPSSVTGHAKIPSQGHLIFPTLFNGELRHVACRGEQGDHYRRSAEVAGGRDGWGGALDGDTASAQ
jgi:transposase